MNPSNCSNVIYNEAYQVWQELGSPTIISVGWISGWFYNNIGKLDNSLNLCSTGVTGTFNPPLGPLEWDIFKTLYKINYYDRMILNSLGAGAASPWVMLQDDVSKIQRTSPNEFAKTYLALKKQSVEDLKEMIWLYERNGVEVGVIGVEVGVGFGVEVGVGFGVDVGVIGVEVGVDVVLTNGVVNVMIGD